MVIYHNPRCRKSREALQIIRDSGFEPEIIEYLKNPPGVEELRSIIRKAGIQAGELIRKNEKVYKEQFRDQQFSEEEWLHAISEYPVLMERPIVIKGERAVVARPPELVKSILS